jgi:hypothetical protein
MGLFMAAALSQRFPRQLNPFRFRMRKKKLSFSDFVFLRTWQRKSARIRTVSLCICGELQFLNNSKKQRTGTCKILDKTRSTFCERDVGLWRVFTP